MHIRITIYGKSTRKRANSVKLAIRKNYIVKSSLFTRNYNRYNRRSLAVITSVAKNTLHFWEGSGSFYDVERSTSNVDAELLLPYIF